MKRKQVKGLANQSAQTGRMRHGGAKRPAAKSVDAFPSQVEGGYSPETVGGVSGIGALAKRRSDARDCGPSPVILVIGENDSRNASIAWNRRSG